MDMFKVVKEIEVKNGHSIAIGESLHVNGDYLYSENERRAGKTINLVGEGYVFVYQYPFERADKLKAMILIEEEGIPCIVTSSQVWAKQWINIKEHSLDYHNQKYTTRNVGFYK